MKKAHLRELRRISESIPKELLAKLTRREPAMPTIKEVATRAQTDPLVSAKEKKRLRAILDSGILDKEVEIIDHDIERQISEHVEREIEKAKKLGRLPKVPPKLLLKKVNKNVKKSNNA